MPQKKFGVHEGGVDGDGVAERLHGHGHVDDDDAVLRGGLADADVLVNDILLSLME